MYKIGIGTVEMSDCLSLRNPFYIMEITVVD
jgi:hypothetical protein